MKSREGVYFMSSINRKIKRNKNIEFKLSMRFICHNCNYTKVIPREVIENIKPEEFANNKMFVCPNCNIRMVPTEVLADF